MGRKTHSYFNEPLVSICMFSFCFVNKTNQNNKSNPNTSIKYDCKFRMHFHILRIFDNNTDL